MIKINLIPFREIEKKENIRRQVTIAILSVILVMMVMAYYHMSLKNTIVKMTDKIESTKIELAAAEKEAKQVDIIKQELNKLNSKINVIKTIEANRKASIKLLDHMTKMVDEQTSAVASGAAPDEIGKPIKRLWFTSFSANGPNININGIALDNKTVADFMTRLEVSKAYNNVTLNTLKKASINNLNLKSFVITCQKAS
ncbi:MAG: PilN domain-containing protein [Desulfobacterales bacterium]|nr:MAG: PilN domain-containing protein [Desulfobacterales bacterium]